MYPARRVLCNRFRLGFVVRTSSVDDAETRNFRARISYVNVLRTPAPVPTYTTLTSPRVVTRSRERLINDVLYHRVRAVIYLVTARMSARASVRLIDSATVARKMTNGDLWTRCSATIDKYTVVVSRFSIKRFYPSTLRTCREND